MKKEYLVSLKLCDYDKQKKKLTLSSEYFGKPPSFEVESHVTGARVKFIPVQPGDPLFCQDQWDGMQMIYRPVFDMKTVDHMVIFDTF